MRVFYRFSQLHTLLGFTNKEKLLFIEKNKLLSETFDADCLNHFVKLFAVNRTYINKIKILRLSELF